MTLNFPAGHDSTLRGECQIVSVFVAASGPLRSRDVCDALELEAQARVVDVDGGWSKFKRLVADGTRACNRASARWAQPRAGRADLPSTTNSPATNLAYRWPREDLPTLNFVSGNRPD